MTSFGMNAIGSAVALLVSLGSCLGDEQSRTPKSLRLPFELDAIVADPRDTVRVCRDIRAPRTDAKIPLPLIACLKNEKVQTIHLEVAPSRSQVRDPSVGRREMSGGHLLFPSRTVQQ
jgi:hypothetical protein